MDTIREESREIPIVAQYDICVIGGSCTGVFAAISAARLGAKTAIVESNGFFGGAATASFVNIWHSIYDTTGKKQIIAGPTVEVIERLKKRHAVSVIEPKDGPIYFLLNTEELKIELDELITEAGVHPFLHTCFSSPILKDGKLVAVAIEDKSGRRAIKASYFVDATGDGDLIVRMGLSSYKNEQLMPPTTSAIIRGINEIQERYPEFSYDKFMLNPTYIKTLKSTEVKDTQKRPNLQRVIGSRDDTISGAKVFETDCSDADQLTKAEIDGRRQVRVICDMLRDNFLSNELVPLVALPARIGIRETRHACCLYRLTEMDVLNGKSFPDAIANGIYPVDVHNADDHGITFRYLNGTEYYYQPNKIGKERKWKKDSSECATFYQIPYSSLIPQGSANVLVAGRVIDADRGAFGAIRVMVNCNQTGTAAGTASYLALNGNTTVLEIDANKLRKTMQRQGSIII